MSCRKTSKPAPKQDTIDFVKLCQNKTEADILTLPAFLEDAVKITKNTSNQVISISKGFDNIKDEMDGLELMVCFEKLEELMFFENRFSVFVEFPAYLTKIKSLKRLEFEGSKFKTLPENIGDLTNLEKIFVQLNKTTWTTLPESFYGLKKLRDIRFFKTGLPNTVQNRVLNTFTNNGVANIEIQFDN